MTEHKIQCTSGVGDTITACRQGEEIEFVARSLDSFTQSVYPSLADARAFARGILALADEVDGGVATAASNTRPSVGDFVEITEDTSFGYVGRRGYLRVVDENDPDYPYHVEMGNGESPFGWWTKAVRKVVDPIDTAPLADWERDLLDSHATTQESTVRGIKAGDKVRVLVNRAEFADVRAGDVFTVARVSGDAIIVNTVENIGQWHFGNPESLEKVVDELATPEEPTKPSRERLLEAAVDAMSGSHIYTANDLIELAEFLTGGKA
ncbi:hypothetical protein [Streptomyces sp. NTK 937]|uniref:hypothetical protein n=1 Tax=Streptomyces sp. NTK 937 TaxID=1487711 RepID=UPI0004A98749|nr:hypothetical protein [Streptomyces sp. NTK 937]KDQ65667.1 hypothetical protein DT87_32865 [Streptomyces sp. NTK 937]KDQ65706.1 hypothetical protein DT87_00160 [Streptomyces sp. NTK 937]